MIDTCFESDQSEAEAIEQSQYLHFEFPPSNTLLQTWQTLQDFRLYILKKNFELGMFTVSNFCYVKNWVQKVYRLRCKFCSAKIVYAFNEKTKKIQITELSNAHIHKISDIQPVYLNLYYFFLHEKVQDHIDNLSDIKFGMSWQTVKVIGNIWYVHLQTLDDILQKYTRQTGSSSRKWKDETQKIYMLLIITPSMKKSYQKFHQSMNIDFFPTLTKVKAPKGMSRFWMTVLFTGNDNNNRLIIFGAAYIIHNSHKYYQNAKVIQSLFQAFFQQMQNVIPQAIIAAQEQAITIALQRLKYENSYQYSHVINWAKIIQKIKRQLMIFNYQRNQISKILYLMKELLGQRNQNLIILIIKALSIKLRNHLAYLYQLLAESEKYCFYSLQNKFCGFGFNNYGCRSYHRMKHCLLFNSNFYQKLCYVSKCQEILLKKASSVKLSTRRINKRRILQIQLEIFATKFTQQFEVFKIVGSCFKKIIETNIFQKLLENFNEQREFIFQKQQKIYTVYSNDYTSVLALIHYSSIENRWICSCGYQFKVGIPCSHLLKVILQEFQKFHKYIDQRWVKLLISGKLREPNEALKKLIAPNVMSRKKRIHN